MHQRISSTLEKHHISIDKDLQEKGFIFIFILFGYTINYQYIVWIFNRRQVHRVNWWFVITDKMQAYRWFVILIVISYLTTVFRLYLLCLLCTYTVQNFSYPFAQVEEFWSTFLLTDSQRGVLYMIKQTPSGIQFHVYLLMHFIP